MNSLLLSNQTKLVNKLLSMDIIEYDDIENLGEEEVYFWFLIDNNYIDNFKKLNLPIITYEGSTWIGQTWYGCSWENTEYFQKLSEDLQFLKNMS